jgi:GT2 family glycosyltransferase
VSAVGVVIPIYNGERFLAEALESVFNQTYADYDVICVDDGSTDGSVSIIEGFGDRVRLVQQCNAGGCAARNEGVRRSSGPYVAFLDQDDRWYPRKLEQQVKALDANPDAVLALCNSDRMDTEGRLLQVGATVTERPGLLTEPLGRLIGEDQLLSSAIMVRREAFVRAGMFDEQLHGFEDFDLAARLRQEGRFLFIAEPGMCYRINQGGQSQSGGLRIIRSRERFLLKMQELYRNDPVKQELIRLMLADCYSDWGWSEVRGGNLRAGREKLRQSLGQNPLRFRTYSRFLRSLF